jgi:hypothetical protein
MAALYHALGTSRILEGLVACRSLVEPRRGIGFARLGPLSAPKTVAHPRA